jgi:cyclophilin family peptidyl-prolyl cis-trans isomerase
LPVGRLEIELFGNTPKTSEFFRKLCTGEMTDNWGKRISLIDTKFHGIIPGFIAKGGNVQGVRIETMNFQGEVAVNKHN